MSSLTILLRGAIKNSTVSTLMLIWNPPQNQAFSKEKCSPVSAADIELKAQYFGGGGCYNGNKIKTLLWK